MSTNEELRRENELLRKAVTHWRANHDNRVKAARFLIEGAHVPLERVTAYEEMVRFQAKVAELERKRAAFLETITRFEEALLTISKMKDSSYYKMCPHEVGKDAELIAAGALLARQKIES